MDREITFGKHAGKMFSEVFRDDRGYCDWLLTTKDNAKSKAVKDFIAYIEASQDDIEIESDSEKHKNKKKRANKNKYGENLGFDSVLDDNRPSKNDNYDSSDDNKKVAKKKPNSIKNSTNDTKNYVKNTKFLKILESDDSEDSDDSLPKFKCGTKLPIKSALVDDDIYIKGKKKPK